jgi:hypothetical protein
MSFGLKSKAGSERGIPMKSRVYRGIFFTMVALMVGLVVTFAGMPSKSVAAGKYQYKVVFYGRSTSGDVTTSMQNILDEYSNQGWELAAVESMAGNLIFRK